MNNLLDLNINQTSNVTDYEMYDYDTSYFLDSSIMKKFIPAIIIYSLTFILGIFGNILVILTIMNCKKLKNNTNTFILSLAVTDLLLIIACVPIRITEFFSNYWRLGKFMCKTTHYIQNISVFCSVFHLIIITLERYSSFKNIQFIGKKLSAKKVILAIWILSFIAASPILIGKAALEIGSLVKVEICIRVWQTPYWQLFEIYRALLVLIIPVSILTFAYISIFLKLKRMGMEIDKKTIFMLILVVLGFIICWTPITINHLLVAFGILPNENVGILWYLRLYFAILSYFNSCINPFIYGFFSKDFRDGFKSIMKSLVSGCSKSNHTVEPNGSTNIAMRLIKSIYTTNIPLNSEATQSHNV